ncbi:hypothetical protein DSUL_130010 [Desulfovibrionales bacterium]
MKSDGLDGHITLLIEQNKEVLRKTLVEAVFQRHRDFCPRISVWEA